MSLSRAPTPIDQRQYVKLKHIEACLLPESQYKKSSGFADVELVNQSASELSLNEINLATTLLHHHVKAPLMIAPMTGGIELGGMLNRRWAKAAQHFGIPFGVGSQRLALDDDSVKESFLVRPYARDVFIFANLGAGQIMQNGVEKAINAVKMIEANALFIHLNPLQEACQEKGDKNFSGLLAAIALIVDALRRQNLPVLVREVGFGLSEEATARLLETGIAGLDCAGAGGTSWSKVESLCARDEKYRRLGEVFGEWGIPTAQSIRNVRNVSKEIPLIATGGLRSGLDVAKAIALGADIAAMAEPMLRRAIVSEEELFSFIETILDELRVAMFASGARDVASLQQFSRCGK